MAYSARESKSLAVSKKKKKKKRAKVCLIRFLWKIEAPGDGHPELKAMVSLAKKISLGKMGHTWKSGSHLNKWVTLGKMGHTWKTGSQFRKVGLH